MATRSDGPSKPLLKVIAETQETSWSSSWWGQLRESGFHTNINCTISSQNISWNTLSIEHDDSKRWVLSLNKRAVSIMSSVNCQQRSCMLCMTIVSQQFLLFCLAVGVKSLLYCKLHTWLCLIAAQLRRRSFLSSTNYFVFLRLWCHWLSLFFSATWIF